MLFGDVLRQLLEDNNMTQKQLGLELNIAPTTIGNYVRNVREPDYRTLKMIAAYFKVTTDQLLGEQNQDISVDENMILKIYRDLDDEYKKILISQAKALYKTSKK